MDKKDKFDFQPSPNNQRSPFRIRWSGLTLSMFIAFFLALALANLISPVLSNILNGIFNGVAPIFIGIFVAFIFYRLVNFTENVILRNAFRNSPHKFGLKRFISILIVVAIVIGIIALVFSILIPKIVSVIMELTDQSGSGWNDLVRRIVDEISALIYRWFGLEVEQESIINVLNSLFDYVSETVLYLNSIMNISVTLISSIFNFIIGLILAILMLKDKEKVARFTKRYVYSHFKKETADEMVVLTRNSSKILFDYIICKLIEFAILFITMGITYSLLGLKFTWELALIIGIFNFIPYFGVYIGGGVSAVITLIFNSMNSALYLVLATVILTTILGNTLIPFITGNKLKVSALVVICSIIIGGAMFGIIGMFLAPPIAAILSLIITSNIELKENKMQYAMEVGAITPPTEVVVTQGNDMPLEPIYRRKKVKAEQLTIESEGLELDKQKEEKAKNNTKNSKKIAKNEEKTDKK